jgi:transcriptional regulator with XRE-family HTH domain
MTQQELSEVAGIPRNSLSQMENAAMTIDIDQLGRIAAAWHIGPDQFLTNALSHASSAELAELLSSGAVVLPTTEADEAEILMATKPKGHRARK